MRTTVDLPDDLLAAVQEESEAGTRREALIIALEDYVRRRRLERLARAAGTLDLDLDVRELREAGRRRLDR